MTHEKIDLLFAARKAMDHFLPQAAGNAFLAQEYAPIMRPWVAGTMEIPVTYNLDDLRTENGVPYKCTQPHTHRGEPNWNPASGSAIWRRFHGTTPETAWEFTADAANPYLKGEFCLENGKAHECLADSTVYPPSAMPDQWKEAQ